MLQCLSHLPHNPNLTATVPPDISLIPGINASGSYYDDFVYIHMDLNTRVSLRYTSRWFDLTLITRSSDTQHWLVLPIPSLVCRRIRDGACGEVRLHRRCTLLELVHRSVQL